nr:unnamed protein product [Callosobruchus chinensis]
MSRPSISRLVVYNKRCCDHFLRNQNNHETIFYRRLALHQLKSIQPKTTRPSQNRKHKGLWYMLCLTTHLFVNQLFRSLEQIRVSRTSVARVRMCVLRYPVVRIFLKCPREMTLPRPMPMNPS